MKQAIAEFNHVDYLWDDKKVAAIGDDQVELFLYRSNILGADLRITNYGGGNTSCKTIEKDPLTNEEVEVMWVKGSGGDIGTLSRAGLAFQAILPKLSTFWVTILAGAIATIAGLFPAFAMKLLGFVALYGFILAPFGAIIAFEHFFHDKWGITKNYAEVAGLQVNKAVLFAWAISFGLFYFISVKFDVFLSFVTLPSWLLCGFLFMVFSKRLQKKKN